jgi:hypothetical protein
MLLRFTRASDNCRQPESVEEVHLSTRSLEMKRTLITAAGFALAAACGLASAASWSVIVEPGVYGRVPIGGYAEPPQVVAPQPVVAIDNGYGQVVEETVDQAYATDQPPVYLWVPEYQRLHWAQYSRDYGAYGVPVYFVDDGWYRANVLRRNWTPEQRSWTQQQWLEQDRLARDRFERQRFEQQRYEQQQRWNNERGWHDPQPGRTNDPRAQQAHWDHDRAQQDAQARAHWGSAPGYAAQAAPANPGVRAAQGGNVARQAAGAYQSGYAGNAAPQQAQAGAASQARGAGRGEDQAEGRGQERGERRGQAEGRGAHEHGREGNRDR